MKTHRCVITVLVCLFAVGCAAVQPEAHSAAAGTAEKVRVVVLGGVRKPGMYEFAPHERCTLRGLVQKMGGLSELLLTRDVRVEQGRWGEKQRVVDIEELVRNPALPDVKLSDGDRVVFPALR